MGRLRIHHSEISEKPMNYAQTFIRVLVLVACSLAINAHLEPRTEPVTASELQVRGKTKAMLKACKRIKKHRRKNYEQLCGKFVEKA